LQRIIDATNNNKILDKKTTAMVGVYSCTVILLVFIFYLFPYINDSNVNNTILTKGNNLEKTSDQQNTTLNSMSLSNLFEKSTAGVVRVSVTRSDEQSSRSLGSGVVYDTSGYIVTNNHVVQAAKKITVTFNEGDSYNGKIVGTDPYSDLAVIKIDADSSALHPLPLGDSKKLRIGDEVAAIGNPFGLTGSLTSGIVSQTGRLLSAPGNSSFSIPDIIQTDAAINPGNSGGPLLDMDGHVVGINTAIQSDTGQFSGIGFAIPSSTVSKIVPVLIKDGQYHHPWLGVSGMDVTSDLAQSLGLPETKGFLVSDVVKNGPADKAGMHGSTQTKEADGIKYKIGGDIIISVDGSKVSKIDEIISYTQNQKNVGDKITLGINRDGRIINAVLTLEERPQLNQ